MTCSCSGLLPRLQMTIMSAASVPSWRTLCRPRSLCSRALRARHGQCRVSVSKGVAVAFFMMYVASHLSHHCWGASAICDCDSSGRQRGRGYACPAVRSSETATATQQCSSWGYGLLRVPGASVGWTAVGSSHVVQNVCVVCSRPIVQKCSILRFYLRRDLQSSIYLLFLSREGLNPKLQR